jgi:hypothetical protein
VPTLNDLASKTAKAMPEVMSEVLHMPPLILHPFSGGSGPGEPLEGMRASLALHGLIASDDGESELYRRMLAGRYQEVRMLIFLGKDIFRWLRQCVEHMRSGEEADNRILEQSFSALIVENPPEQVKRKLEDWGVTDRKSVLSRAIGIHSLFQEPPAGNALSPIFLTNYHRYADHAYICFQHLKAFLPLDPRKFQFEIYASEEYARLLSEQWEPKA